MKKKIILTAILPLILLTGCSSKNEEAATTSADNENLQVDAPAKVLSAGDVEQSGNYSFVVSDDVVDGYDTYKLTDTIKISAQDQTDYNLYASKEEITNTSNITPVEFNGEYRGSVDQTTYYVLEKGDESDIDVVISTT